MWRLRVLVCAASAMVIASCVGDGTTTLRSTEQPHASPVHNRTEQGSTSGDLRRSNVAACSRNGCPDINIVGIASTDEQRTLAEDANHYEAAPTESASSTSIDGLLTGSIDRGGTDTSELAVLVPGISSPNAGLQQPPISGPSIAPWEAAERWPGTRSPSPNVPTGTLPQPSPGTAPPGTTSVPSPEARRVVGCATGDGLPYRGDILPYLRSDQNVTVPPGRYSIGDLSTQGVTHMVDENRSDWVTVKAAIPGTVVVDGSLNNSAVRFEGEGLGANKRSQKLVVAGIHWIGTSLMFRSTQDISLWYTCHEYTPRQWHMNAMESAARNNILLPATGPKDPHGDGGGLYSLDPNGTEWLKIAQGMGAFLPSGIRGDTGSGASQNLRFFGVDVGPVADDGIYMGGSFNMVIEGARIHSISEFYWQPDGDGVSVDPGPVFGTQKDQFHNDGIQIGKAGWRPTIVDTWSEGRIMFNKIVNPSKTEWDLRVRRSWFGPSIAANTGGSDQVKKLTDDPVFADWLQRDSGGPWPAEPVAVISGYTPWAGELTGEISDITHIQSPGRSFVFLYDGSYLANNDDYPDLFIGPVETTTLGLGTYDIFNSVDEIGSHPENPAVMWRSAHPYDDLSTFAGLTASAYRPD